MSINLNSGVIPVCSILPQHSRGHLGPLLGSDRSFVFASWEQLRSVETVIDRVQGESNGIVLRVKQSGVLFLIHEC